MKFEQIINEKENTEEKVINIMDMDIETDTRQHDRIPSLEDKPSLQEFTVDESAKKLMKKILESVATDDPLLLEGDPAVGKNITIEYLAAKLNRPLYRVPLNGQTDIGALVGKWVPKNSALEQQLYSKIKNRSSMSNESKKILEKYFSKSEKVAHGYYDNIDEQPAGQREFLSKEISKEDIMQIAENENIEISDEDWVWQDSEIVQAIDEGAWLVLDEVNTAEPQILVRLNALLEKGGEMILSENSNRKVKKDSKFRVFGTMNPPGGRIKGRVQLSEDYVSRWRFASVEGMSSEEYLNRLLISEGLRKPESLGLEEDEDEKKKNIEGHSRLTDIYEDEWVEEFYKKYVTFFYKLKKMVGKDINTQSGKEQNINYDDRDRTRFINYILMFHKPGNFNKTIQNALELFYEKLKFKNDKDKVKKLAEDIIQLDEPVEKNINKDNKEGNYDNTEELSIISNLLNDNSLTDNQKERLTSLI